MLSSAPKNGRVFWIIGLGLLVITAAVYGQVVRFEFAEFWDDGLFITRNLSVQNGLSWGGLWWAFTTTSGYLWHPFVWLSLMLDAEIYGLDPGGFHLTNLLLHLANTLVLFGLLSGMTGAPWRSGFVAALFALHPLHVESVAWVTERKDLLSTFFSLGTLWAYWGYVRRRGVGRYVLVAVCFGAALLSKPMAVTLPVVMVLLDYWPLRRHLFSPRRPSPPLAGGDVPAISLAGKGERGLSALWRPALWVEKIPLLVMAAAVSVVTVIAMRSLSLDAVGADSWSIRVQTAVVAYGFYLFKMVWPFNLAMSYPHPGAFPLWEMGAAAAGLVCISVLVLRGAVRRPYLLTGWLWYGVTLLPVSGLFAFGGGFWMAADRFTYIPLVGPFIMIAWLVPELPGGRRYGRVVLCAGAGVVLAALMVLTWRQVQVWRNSTTLFDHAMRVRPGNWPAMKSMAILLENRGRLEEAVSLWREALSLRPGDVEMWNSLAGALLAKGETEQAMAESRELLRLAPAYPWGHITLGRALTKQGRLEEARKHFERALELKPELPESHYPQAHYGLASVLATQGSVEKALSHYLEVLRLRSGFPELHYNIGVALGRLGRTEEAISHYRQAVEGDPGYTLAWFNLGVLLGRQGKIEEALSCYRKVLSIKPDFAEAHYLLGSAYARQGNRNEALRHHRALQKLKPSLAETLLREIEAVP